MDAKDIHRTLHEAARQHAAGHTREAASLYQKILAVSAENPEANHNLGVLTMQTGGKLDVALPFFKRAWQSNPTHQQHWLSYLQALRQANDLETAKTVYADGQRRGLKGPNPVAAVKPVSPSAANRPSATEKKSVRRNAPAALKAQLNEINQLVAAQKLSEAISSSKALCNANPEQPEAWRVLGFALAQSGSHEEALRVLTHAERLAPGDTQTRLMLGKTCYALQRFTDAERVLRALDADEPENPDVVIVLANTLLRLYKHEESQAICETALQHHRNLAALHNCYGAALQAQNKDESAIAAYEQGHTLEPGALESYFALYRLYDEHNRQADLFALCQRIAQSVPQYKSIHADLGTALLRAGRVDDAAIALDRALALQPDSLVARSNWLFCQNYLGRLPAAERYAEAVRYGELVSQQANAFTRWHCESPPQTLRVGLVSGDFRRHPVGYFLQNVLANADKSSIEWLAYSTRTAQDEVTAQLREHVSDWHVIAGLSDEAIAQQIHADAPHLLIDLAGHTGHNALPAFAWKPAPVQVSWLGYFATTGVKEIDYLMVDDVGAGNDQQPYFSETLWRLPESRLCFTPPSDAPAVAPPPAIKNGYVTFGCFQNLRKISDDVLTLWAAVLQAVPNAKLRLQSTGLENEEMRTDFCDRANRAGIETTRLALIPPTDRHTYLGAHGEVDILLDTFPFPGGTTTCEALWMGVPTLTLTGESLLERQGDSILTAAGYPDWVARSARDYVTLAAQFAKDLAQLADLRSSMRSQIAETALFNGSRFAEQFSQALWEMWADSADQR